MRRCSFIVLGILTLAMQFFLPGCTKDTSPVSSTVDVANSKAKSDQAYQLVENEMMTVINGHFTTAAQYDQLKFTSALTLYNDALTLNPKNTDALFGAAVTEMLAAYSDADMNSLVKTLDSTGKNNSSILSNLTSSAIIPSGTNDVSLSTAPAAAGLIFSLQKALTDPPLVSRVQSVLSNSFLPRVQRAIDHLSAIDSSESFKFTISGKMQGDASLQPVTVYVTEAAFMNGIMNFLKFNIESMLIYQFPLTDYKQATLLSALAQSNTTFFVLQSDGKQHAANAKAAFSTSIAKVQKAIDYIKRISGNKSDAILKLGANGIKTNDLDTLNTYLNKVVTSLSSDYSITVKNADSDNNSYTIKVNLGNFFSNPPQNPKQALLPAYTVTAVGTNDINMDFNAQTYADFTFPDPTFGGLFPGMPQETLKRILHIDERYQFEMSGWVQVLPYTYDSYSAQGLTVAITIGNGTTYQTTTTTWGNFDLKIPNVSTVPVSVTKFSITANGNEIVLKNISPNLFAGIKAKSHLWAPVTIVIPPVSLLLQKLSSPLGVQAIWETATGASSYNTYGYALQRRTASSSYSDISYQQTYNGLIINDYNVTSGTQYYYRVRTLYAPDFATIQMYGDLILVPGDTYYSNEAGITLAK